ncbi:MAG: glutathione S-transferase family protein [Pseudomonadota bacterium]
MIILHNYPQSPVAEKVRVALGIKGASWASVEIPRIPPKPNLVKLTGGYRRTPVMQIGADIWCDSQHIIRAIDANTDGPSLYPARAGLAEIVSRWADADGFPLAVKIVLGSAGDALPADFAEDRGRLYLGPDWAERLKAANAELPHLAAQMRSWLGWLDGQLADQPFLVGDAPTAVDAQIYHMVWFVRGRWDQGPQFLSEFPNLERWEAAVRDLGHGAMTDMTPEAAIEAAKVDPVTPEGVAPGDPQGWSVGDAVAVTPDVNGGEQAVEGRIHAADATGVAILREDPHCGALCVHFPRLGYRIDRA